jgi:hypothetical protein
MYKIFEKVDCKLVTSKTMGQGATAPRRRARRAPHLHAGYPQRPRPLTTRHSPPPETGRVPRLHAYWGRPRPTTHRGQHRTTRRARRATAGRVPLRTGGPSAFPHPRAPCYGRESHRRHPQTGPALFNCCPFPLCAPPSRKPAIAAVGELAAPLAPAAGRLPQSLP